MSKLYVKWQTRVIERIKGEQRDEGAGFVEYAGLLVLIAAIVAAVMGLGLDDTISNAIDEAVNEITGG
ncbi:hypothetical protein H9Y04_34415 [Streptomyces sp. TRM66268-LWL]|uniref:Flp family type IVb pilin n=1 Tax=Streptomyces polyasparticus TaxID=2767826 RepID=A0ABR7STM2_9ACTN|nr:hypothetical protein [Streptomyces polyasparticus]MBC9717638.1 hypothetical protein [Streptomyces polyasparticus]